MESMLAGKRPRSPTSNADETAASSSRPRVGGQPTDGLSDSSSAEMKHEHGSGSILDSYRNTVWSFEDDFDPWSYDNIVSISHPQ